MIENKIYGTVAFKIKLFEIHCIIMHIYFKRNMIQSGKLLQKYNKFLSCCE